jgi:hypothetical protein
LTEDKERIVDFKCIALTLWPNLKITGDVSDAVKKGISDNFNNGIKKKFKKNGVPINVYLETDNGYGLR